MTENKNVVIIVKKKKVQGEGGAHGGSWKVAYADFVTAMMAFFLMMWLLNMSTKEQKEGLAEFFQEYSIFAGQGGGQDEDASGPSSSSTTFIDQSEEEAKPMDKEMMQEVLKEKLQMELEHLKDQVLVQTFDKGVKIQVVDKQGSMMFPTGSGDPTPQGKKVLAVVTKNIKSFSGKVAIEGHTDSRPYTSKGYSNWDLSVVRAASARREMARNGLPMHKVMRISGYADTEPLNARNTLDPKNRRISILIFTNKPF